MRACAFATILHQIESGESADVPSPDFEPVHVAQTSRRSNERGLISRFRDIVLGNCSVPALEQDV